MYKNFYLLMTCYVFLLIIIFNISTNAYADQCHTKHIARITTEGKFFAESEHGKYLIFRIKNDILGLIKIVANKNEVVKQHKKIPPNGSVFEVTFDQTQLRCQKMNLIVNFLISLNTVKPPHNTSSMDRKARKNIPPQQMEQLKELKEALNFVRD